MKFERYGIGIARGMMVTFKHLFRHPTVSQYPEQRLNMSRRTRGNELIWNNVKCTGCVTCAKSCPQGAIHIETTVDPATNKYNVLKIEVDTGYCIQCGLCVEACPYEAIYMGYSVERAKYRRGELVQANEMLLASPDRPASGYMNPHIARELPRQTLLVEKIVEKR
ncbi:MAG: 4Fe-4S dicluster domain-containing protein [Dehalococcoidia bacterium]|nr:4Fe-4S dicluster domain-containing protein [Dehalococcoidia bacterium]